MRIEQVEIYSDVSNFAVMRHPGRNFPGSLIQGDSLSLLLEEATELYSLACSTGNEDLIELAREHKEKLEVRLSVFAEAMSSHNISYPGVSGA